VFGLSRAEVALVRLEEARDVTVETLLPDLSFANGIAVAPDGATLAVAETRADRVSFYDLPRLLSGDKAALRRRVRLPGGPDNLTWTPGGQVLAAVHPSLMDVGFARLRWFGYRRAGSQVSAIAPDSGETRSLLRDPDGKHINMATSAIILGDTLVASGVLDDALLACKLAAPHRDGSEVRKGVSKQGN
jgi:sugar lactone lactonase YvrE